MTVAFPVTPIRFELRYKRMGADYNKFAPKFDDNEFTINPERLAALPEEPTGFRPLDGDLPTVTAEADRLNNAQLRSGLLDFFFFPDVAGPDVDGTHCDACRRAAIEQAMED